MSDDKSGDKPDLFFCGIKNQVPTGPEKIAKKYIFLFIGLLMSDNRFYFEISVIKDAVKNVAAGLLRTGKRRASAVETEKVVRGDVQTIAQVDDFFVIELHFSRFVFAVIRLIFVQFFCQLCLRETFCLPRGFQIFSYNFCDFHKMLSSFLNYTKNAYIYVDL